MKHETQQTVGSCPRFGAQVDGGQVTAPQLREQIMRTPTFLAGRLGAIDSAGTADSKNGHRWALGGGCVGCNGLKPGGSANASTGSYYPNLATSLVPKLLVITGAEAFLVLTKLPGSDCMKHSDDTHVPFFKSNLGPPYHVVARQNLRNRMSPLRLSSGGELLNAPPQHQNSNRAKNLTVHCYPCLHSGTGRALPR